MNNPTTLLDVEDKWLTHMGAWFPGQRVVYRGKDLFHDLKNLSWMQLYLYGITGRHFTESQSKLFEGMWSLCTSYPDPRLWNNRIGSLAGTTRSTGALGISAAIAISEAKIYGCSTAYKSMKFLRDAQRQLNNGRELKNIIADELNKSRVIYGYGRPIVSSDERIEPLLNLAKELALASGTFTKVAFKVEETLQNERKRIRMNIAALGAALAADQGLSEYEYYLFLIPCFTAGIMPCFIESNQRPEGTFLPLRCERINYSGVPPRKWTFPKDVSPKDV